jgi:hypothetical protein
VRAREREVVEPDDVRDGEAAYKLHTVGGRPSIIAMMVSKRKWLPLNAAVRNAVWAYPRLVSPRFAGAPAIVETTRSHEMPDFSSLPEGADVEVQLYGGAVVLALGGERRRVYVERFVHRTYPSEAEACEAFLSLWREVSPLESAAEVANVAREWYERQGEPPECEDGTRVSRRRPGR